MVYCTGLLNRQAVRSRKFKSCASRQGSRLIEKAYAEASLLFMQRGRLRRRWRNRKSVAAGKDRHHGNVAQR